MAARRMQHRHVRLRDLARPSCETSRSSGGFSDSQTARRRPRLVSRAGPRVCARSSSAERHDTAALSTNRPSTAGPSASSTSPRPCIDAAEGKPEGRPDSDVRECERAVHAGAQHLAYPHPDAALMRSLPLRSQRATAVLTELRATLFSAPTKQETHGQPSVPTGHSSPASRVHHDPRLVGRRHVAGIRRGRARPPRTPAACRIVVVLEAFQRGHAGRTAEHSVLRGRVATLGQAISTATAGRGSAAEATQGSPRLQQLGQPSTAAALPRPLPSASCSSAAVPSRRGCGWRRGPGPRSIASPGRQSACRGGDGREPSARAGSRYPPPRTEEPPMNTSDHLPHLPPAPRHGTARCAPPAHSSPPARSPPVSSPPRRPAPRPPARTAPATTATSTTSVYAATAPQAQAAAASRSTGTHPGRLPPHSFRPRTAADRRERQSSRPFQPHTLPAYRCWEVTPSYTWTRGGAAGHLRRPCASS